MMLLTSLLIISLGPFTYAAPANKLDASRLVKRSGFQNLPAHIAADFAASSGSPLYFDGNAHAITETGSNYHYGHELPEHIPSGTYDEQAYNDQWPAQAYPFQEEELQKIYADQQESSDEDQASQLNEGLSSLTMNEYEDATLQDGSIQHHQRRRRLSQREKKAHTVSKKGSSGGKGIFGEGGVAGAGEGSSTPTRSRGSAYIAGDHDDDSAPGPSSGHKKKGLTKDQKYAIAAGSLAGAVIVGYGAKAAYEIHKDNKIGREMAQRGMHQKRSLTGVESDNERTLKERRGFHVASI